MAFNSFCYGDSQKGIAIAIREKNWLFAILAAQAVVLPRALITIVDAMMDGLLVF